MANKMMAELINSRGGGLKFMINESSGVMA